MKLLSLIALSLSLNAFAVTDCDRVLEDLMNLGATRGGSQTLIGQHESQLRTLALIQENFDKYPHVLSLGSYDRFSLKEEVKQRKASIKRLELNLYGISEMEPKMKARAKERCH